MIKDRTAECMIHLAVCAVNRRKPDLNLIENADLDAVYTLASRHMISAAVAFTLESAGYRNTCSSEILALAVNKAVNFEMEWNELQGKLSEAGIWSMPLKGVLLKEYYPQLGMREFVDYDILIDPQYEQETKEIMENQGYTLGRSWASNEKTYFKSPFLNFEIHTSLFGPEDGPVLYAYYHNLKDKLAGSGYKKSFSPEDFYLYFVAHEYKHYMGAGAGFRSLMDLYLYLNRQTVDMAYVSEEAEKLGLREFEEQHRTLAFHLFREEELTDADQEMLECILFSGSFGTFEQRIQKEIQRYGGSRIRYLLKRFHIPFSRKSRDYAIFEAYYPFFYRHRVLLPLLPVYWFFRGIWNGKLQREVRTLMNVKNTKKKNNMQNLSE